MKTFLTIVLAVVQGVAFYGCVSNPRVKTSCVDSGDTRGTINVITLDPSGYHLRLLGSVAEPEHGRPGVWIRNAATGRRLEGTTDAEGHATFRVIPGTYVVVVGRGNIDGVAVGSPWRRTEEVVTVGRGCVVAVTLRLELDLPGPDI
jgi:hypothetical protein